MAKLRLYSKEDVRQAIRRRGNEIASKMTDQELYASAEFANYATKLADFILRKHKLYALDIKYISDPAAPIAYTDGKMIFWNTGNSIAAFPKLLERRFKVNMGILFHECSHKLFLDFTVKKKAIAQIKSGTLYGNFATGGDPDLENAKAELEKVTASGYGSAVAAIYAELENIIADGHDEACMKRCFPGFIADCIKTAGEVQMETSSSLEDLIDARLDGYAIACSLFLQYAKMGYYKIGQGNADTAKYLAFANAMEPIIDEALEQDDLKKRWDQLNLLVLHLWPYLREKFPDNPPSQSGSGSGQPQSGGQGSSGGGGTPQQSGGQGSSQASANSPQQAGNTPSPEEVADAIQKAMEQIAQAMNAAPAPVNGTGSGVSPQAVQAGSMSPGSDSDLADLKNQIAQAEAVAQVQKELDDAQMDAIRNSNVPLVHKNVKMNTLRHNATNKAKYQRIATEIAPLVRNLIRDMKALLRELNEECVQHHRRIGPIIEAGEAYRPDNQFFAKKKLPEDLPNMAMCILIDQSGSMGGSKLECAIRTAIMLEQFASALNIPTMIAGHDVGYNVNFRIFTDYISATGNEDRWSLAGITAGGCNRDGLPLHVCCELLAQRQEQVKLMVVISDGAPNDDGYKGPAAREDIKQIVNSFRRKGLLIYGAAIDKDRKIIEEIYGKGFLSIQNLASLPKTLVRLIRQQII